MTIFGANIRHIALIAPAGITDRDKISHAAEFIRQNGYQATIFSQCEGDPLRPWLAAGNEQRAAEFNRAVSDETIDLIICLRGGSGSAQILPQLDWNTLKKRNLPVIGYSDITALHMAMLKMNAGVPIVAPMAVKLSEALTSQPNAEYTKKSLVKVFENQTIQTIEPPSNKNFIRLEPGDITGLPVCANLTVLASMCGSEWVPDLSDRILLLEDIAEPLYRLDRSFYQIFQSGIISNISALAFGYFTNCGDNAEILQLLRYWTKKIGVPAVAGIPFGHEFPLASIRFDKPLEFVTTS